MLEALADLALPVGCAGCGRAGVRVCPACRAAASGWRGGPRAVVPDPRPTGFPPTWAAAAYAGPLARWVVAYKDGDRRDLRRELAPLLGAAVDAALTDLGATGREPAGVAGPVLLVPVPTSYGARRRRGDHPLTGLARDVARGLRVGEVVLAPVLRVRRRVADQAGLSAVGRAANLAEAFSVRARHAPRVAGARCVVVDDIVTTGSTVVEAARALREAGADVVVAASIAATQRRPVRVLSPSPVLVTPPAFVDYRRDMAGQPFRQTRERRTDRRAAGEGTGAGACARRAPRHGW